MRSPLAALLSAAIEGTDVDPRRDFGRLLVEVVADYLVHLEMLGYSGLASRIDGRIGEVRRLWPRNGDPSSEAFDAVRDALALVEATDRRLKQSPPARADAGRPAVTVAATTGKRRPRRTAADVRMDELKIADALTKEPAATRQKIREMTGIAAAHISASQVWRHHRSAQKRAGARKQAASVGGIHDLDNRTKRTRIRDDD